MIVCVCVCVCMSLRVWASVLFLLKKSYLLSRLFWLRSRLISRPRSRFSMTSVMFAPGQYTTPPAIAAWESGSESVLCETQLMPHKGQYELEKDPKPLSAERKHEHGLYVWAKVKNSSNSVYGPGHSLRVHMCFHNPCRVDWTDAKYGLYGPPVHMQCITCMGPKAAPLLPWTAAPVADPSSITTAVAVAAPSTATAVAAQTPAAAAGAAKRAAMERIRASALQLARETRKPRAWIGYVAFVLFALLKNTDRRCGREQASFVS